MSGATSTDCRHDTEQRARGEQHDPQERLGADALGNIQPGPRHQYLTPPQQPAVRVFPPLYQRCQGGRRTGPEFPLGGHRPARWPRAAELVSRSSGLTAIPLGHAFISTCTTTDPTAARCPAIKWRSWAWQCLRVLRRIHSNHMRLNYVMAPAVSSAPAIPQVLPHRLEHLRCFEYRIA